MPAIKTLNDEVWPDIQTTIKTATDIIKEDVLPVFDDMTKDITDSSNGIKYVVETAWPLISAIIKREVAKIKNVVIGIKTTITAVKTTFDRIKTTVAAAWETVKTKTVAAWNKVKTTVTTGVSTVKTKVDSLKTKLSTTWDSIKTKASTAWERVKSAITKPIQSARDTVQGVVGKIKGFFPISVGNIFSGLKLPHFSVSGGSAPWGIGGKGSLPSWSVSWYKKAVGEPYLFDSPTLFGAGETSDEMLYGRRNLMRDIREAAAGSGQTINNTFNFIVDGAQDPEDWARRAFRELQMQARTA